MKEELRENICKQLKLVNDHDLKDPMVQDDLIRLSNELQYKIIHGR